MFVQFDGDCNDHCVSDQIATVGMGFVYGMSSRDNKWGQTHHVTNQGALKQSAYIPFGFFWE